MSWRHNQKLKNDSTQQNTRIQTLSNEVRSLEDEVKSLKLPQPRADVEATDNFQKLFDNIKVGQVVDTENGRLAVNNYGKTSLHQQVQWLNSEEPILKVKLTITNNTQETQSYSHSQFTFVDSAKLQKNDTDIRRLLESGGYKDILGNVTLEPDGSLQTHMFFDKYDSKQGTFKWLNAYSQEVRVTLPSI